MIRTHRSEHCLGEFCAIHRQMPGPWAGWPRHWRDDRELLERICPCGVGHPVAEMYLIPQTPGRLVHGCCGIHQCFPGYGGDDRPTDVMEKIRDLKTEAADLLLDLWPRTLGATVHLETHEWNRLRAFLLAVIDGGQQ